MAEISLEPLPPAEAIKYFRGKGLAASFAWQDLWEQEHAKAFTAAKAMRPAVLQDIRDAVDQALADGETLETFRKSLTPKLQAAGWWGKQTAVDPLTGEAKIVQLGSPRRLRTIFDTNMRTAYAAGRWERIERVADTLPYLRYQTAEDDRVRPEHAAWDGVTLTVDDPWWDEHNPPCDWGCRCTVIQMSQDELDRHGESVTDTPPAFPDRAYTNPRTGETINVEQGIGPGWGYNVGRAYLERETPSPMPDPGEAHAGAAVDLKGSPIGDFLAGFGARADKTVIWPDQTGDGLVIGPALFKDGAGRPARLAPAVMRHLASIGEVLRAPDVIYRAWRFGPGGDSLLVRRFIGRAGGQNVVVDWSPTGWWAAASPHPVPKSFRAGAVAWSAL